MEVHKGTVGFEYQYNFQLDQRNYDEGIAGGVNLDDRRTSQQWAVYLQGEFPILDTLTFNAGVRFDYFDIFGSTINPGGALIYNPFEKTIFKLIYGRAFRAPTAYELYYHDGYLTQKPNPDLKPETIDTYELVYEQYLGKHYRGTIVGFFNSINDLLALKTDMTDGLLVYENLDTSSTNVSETNGDFPFLNTQYSRELKSSASINLIPCHPTAVSLGKK